MNLKYFLKTSVSIRNDEKRAGKPMGSIGIATSFVSLCFSVLGMGMIALSQAHLKIGKAGELSTILEHASEN
jgi:hypothetical protein